MQHLNPKYISIESQSDINSSNSQKESMQIQTNSRTLTKLIVVQDMYQKFTSTKFYLLTESLKKYANQINDFLEMKKNVLFIFGPSGCGKGTLVRKILAHNSIMYDTVQQFENENDRIVSLGDSILQTLQKQDSRRVHICYDFPIHLQKWNFNEIKQFKRQFSEAIKSTTTKLILILNQQIYNSFYVLNERASSQQNINNRDNVAVMKMQKFGVLELKRILKGFVEYQMLHNYVNLGKEFLDEVVELSNGDLRKALYMLYWKGVENKAQKIIKQQKKAISNNTLERPQFVQKPYSQQQHHKNTNIDFIQEENHNRDLKHHSSCFKNSGQGTHQQSEFSLMSNLSSRVAKPKKYENFLKNKPLPQCRFSLYHGLGKLLYGKRLNIKSNPKNKKDISCYYTEREIKELDPPFYFDPVGLFDQLRIDLDIVTKLLQQNYLERYGKIKDIRKMSQIFVLQDGFFSFGHKIQDEQVKDIKVCLLTWGILIYNRNSRTDNLRFMKIQKSQSTNVDKKAGEKQRLINQYFPQNNVRDMITFGHLTRNTTSLLNDTIFNKSLSRHQITKFDDHTKNIQNEEQQQQIETVMKMTSNDIENKLRQMAKDKEKKKREVRQMLMEMEEQDDENVDDISNSSDSEN